MFVEVSGSGYPSGKVLRMVRWTQSGLARVFLVVATLGFGGWVPDKYGLTIVVHKGWVVGLNRACPL